MTNKSNKSNRTYKSYRIYWTYVFLLALLFSFFPQSSTPARAGFLSRPPTSLGLVGYWPMDEGAGSKAGDFSGSGNTGTITGATWTNGRHGKALSFLSSGSQRVTAPPSKTGFTNLTISFWFRPTGAQTTSGIYSWADTVQNGNPWILFQRENATTARWFFNAGYRVSWNINDDTWYHATVTYDGTTWLAYLNGIQNGSYVGSLGTYQGGQQNFGTGYSNYYSGKLDDVRVYNRALTASEISKIYSSGQTTLKKVSEQGLVGYWSMNEGQGGKVGDSSGNNNTGTITGATWTSGKKGKGLSFDGNDYINAGTSETLNTTGDFSASLWFKTPGPGLNSWDALLARSNVAYFVNAPNKGWHIISRNISGTNAINFQYSGASAAQNLSWTGGDDNLWHHVVATRQGNLFSIYIDSVLKSSLTTAVGDMSMPGESLFIGKGKFTDYFHGSLDDVRIYNRALSVGEIQSLYKQNETMANAPQNNKLTNGLVGLWSFNGKDVSGTTAYDRSGQGNNGNITGGAKLDAGKVGQGMSFDGVDDQVNVSPASSINSLTSLSLSFWAKANDYGEINQGHLISKVDANSGGHGWYLNHNITTSRINFGVNFANIDLNVAVYNVINFNVWNHWAVIWDGSTTASNVHIYKNGQELSHSSETNGDGAYSSDSALNLIIANHGSLGRHFDGLMDEVRIYNRALSADEVKQLYRMGQ